MSRRLAIPVVASFLFLTACGGGYVAMRVPPPPPPPVVVGYAPGPGYVWCDNAWLRPPRPRAYWVTGRWAWNGNRYHWRRGHWAW